MKIAIGSDHGGYALKMQLIPVIEKLGHSVQDFGCYDETSVDYPDIAFPVAEAVAEDRKSTRQNSSHWKQSRMPSSA